MFVHTYTHILAYWNKAKCSMQCHSLKREASHQSLLQARVAELPCPFTGPRAS